MVLGIKYHHFYSMLTSRNRLIILDLDKTKTFLLLSVLNYYIGHPTFRCTCRGEISHDIV